MGLSKYFTITAGILTGMLALIIAAHVFGVNIVNKKVLQSCQGDYVKYNSLDPYCLTIIKQVRPLGSDYIIMVSGKGSDNYGHVFNYIEPDPGSEEDIVKTRIIWSNEGIEITFNTGHKLYVPKELFIAQR